MLKEKTNQVKALEIPPPILTIFKHWKLMCIKRIAKNTKSISGKELLPIWEFVNTALRILKTTKNSLEGQESFTDEATLIAVFFTKSTTGLME